MVGWSSLIFDDDDDDVDLFRGKRAALQAAVQFAVSQHVQQPDRLGCGPQGPKLRDQAPFQWGAHVKRLVPQVVPSTMGWEP